MGKFILIIILLIILIFVLFPKAINKSINRGLRNLSKKITLRFLKTIFSNAETKVTEEKDKRDEGDTIIKPKVGEEKQSKNPEDTGEFINFEEIKD